MGGAEDAAGPDQKAPTLSSTQKTASHLSRRVPFILMSMSARTRMRLLGESRFCRAHGVWEKGVRHRGGSIRASIERARVGTVVCGREVEGPLQARDEMRRGSIWS